MKLDTGKSPKFVVSEGVSGMWHYHISAAEEPHLGQCGARTMRTEIPISDWMIPFGEHLPKRPTWCRECSAIFARDTSNG
jgi:hypothetical protein